MTVAEKKAQQEKWLGAEAIMATERAVRAELRDPDAVQFREVRANYTEDFGVVACGRVNAKNEFGGYTGFWRFVFGDGRVIFEGRDNVVDAWTAAYLSGGGRLDSVVQLGEAPQSGSGRTGQGDKWRSPTSRRCLLRECTI